MLGRIEPMLRGAGPRRGLGGGADGTTKRDSSMGGGVPTLGGGVPILGGGVPILGGERGTSESMSGGALGFGAGDGMRSVIGGASAGLKRSSAMTAGGCSE
jgi:hypothetical protein